MIGKIKSGLVPKDYDEFIKLWDRRIDLAVRRYRLSQEQYEDLKQDIYSEFITRDYLHKIYDSKKGAFSTFVYNFVNTRALRFACKSTALKQKFVSNLDSDLGGDSNIDASLESASLDYKVVDYLTANDKIFWSSSLNSVMKEFQSSENLEGFLITKGEIVERSMWKLFSMLRDGFSREAVAEKMNYSLDNINKLIMDMRSVPAVIRLRETYHDISNNLVKSVSPISSLGLF